MNARILRTAVPGAVFLAALSATGFAQTPPLAGQSPRQNQASPNPVTKQYALPYALNNHANPAATPTPAPGAVIVSGKLRGYSFDRVNHVHNASNPNRHSTEFGFEPHIDYRIGNTPLNIGYTYFGGTGFGLNGPNPIANGHVDNTLPGFPLDQPIHEAYIQYKDANNTFTFGDQELNYAWTPNSDSRIVPASYQGLDSSIKLTRTLTFGLTDILRFEQRNSSNFEPNTLLTAPYPQTSSLIAKSGTQTPGTLIIGLTYKPASNVNVTAQDYQFYDLANMIYVEGRVGLAPKLKANPYLATQLVEETSIGQGQIGIVRNQTIGAQLGATVSKGLLLAVSTDIAPWKYAFVRAKSATAAESGYFIPGGGTGAAAADGPGLYRVAYGGIASPYTDSLGTDPLYTSNITQGMADRRSAGNSAKIAAVYTTPNNQFKLIASEGYFQYSNAISRNITSEYNLDGTYFLNKVRANHPYHGLFVRVRYAPRTVPTLPYNFQYQRFQTEYDF